MLFRKNPISRHEIIADAAYFLISALVSLLAVFLFDFHHFFYPQARMASPERIFDSPLPYVVGVLFGGIFGLFLTKLLFMAFREEETARKKKR